jgi:ubiquinone/menaquinone biosynthesis C-methylase UbiE
MGNSSKKLCRMRLITFDDIIESYTKARQRGFGFLISKLKLDGLARTKSAFDASSKQHSNWWLIPGIRERWNLLISGDPQVNYKQFLVNDLLGEADQLRLLSLGSGSGGHEMELAAFPVFEEITCIEIAQNRIDEARREAEKRGLRNIHFICVDFNKYEFPKERFDLVLFNSSLHHFNRVEKLLSGPVKRTLKHGGRLIINEYVGPTRLQFPREQRLAINQALKLIPEKYKTRFKTRLLKRKFYGPGLLRMILADPSECIDSASILPALHAHYTTLVEKPYGGNILMNVLKDISHHFTASDPESEASLAELIQFEDNYLKTHPSDFIFGLYEKPLGS